jgi:hypothetical protein
MYEILQIFCSGMSANNTTILIVKLTFENSWQKWNELYKMIYVKYSTIDYRFPKFRNIKYIKCQFKSFMNLFVLSKYQYIFHISTDKHWKILNPKDIFSFCRSVPKVVMPYDFKQKLRVSSDIAWYKFGPTINIWSQDPQNSCVFPSYTILAVTS